MKIRVHPLFFVFGLYFALIGKVFLFLTATLTALVHELGHAFCAERLGYKMNKITLMPYGAVVNGAIEGLSYADEIIVAVSGPLINLFICLFFTALWWLVPVSYPYTDTVVFCNLSVAAVNLLPAYPLDGGRILSAYLSRITTRKKCILVVKIFGFLLGGLLLTLFIYSCFFTVNFTILFFAAFILTGAITKTKENAYVKIFKNRAQFLKGVKEVKKLIVSSETTLKQLILSASADCFYTLEVIDRASNRTTHLNREQTEKLLSSYRHNDTVGQIANL